MTGQIEAVNALRSMSAEELEDHLHEQRRRLFEVRFQQAAGQVDNHRQIRALRREIARTMTIQVEVAHGHRLASEAALESGAAVPEAEDEPRRRRLFRRGGEPAAPTGEAVTEPEAAPIAEAETEPEAIEAPAGAAAEVPEAIESVEPEGLEADEEPEAAESTHLESSDAEADPESPEEAAPPSGSDAATENQS
jgi:large subunit ribosomal protein L29